MCGIVGVYNFGAEPQDERARLERMRDAMAHRGPDDAGMYQSADQRVTFGHRRLSIVDLSAAGHQPMGNADGSIWLTFNGEIYNHADHRADLEARGHKFRSRSDTEAIIYLYEEYGPDCLLKLDGMFAFGIWDAPRQRLMLARDYLGKKPLYYTVTGTKLLFASEIKALLAHPEVKRDLDPAGLDLFLSFSNVAPPHTLFAGIRKLPAAHRLFCDRRGELRVERYWSPLGDKSWPRQVDETEAIHEVGQRLRKAVKKRMMSDVPVGAFLSGGVDSSANVALMSELVSQPLQTYSVGFTGFGPAENFHDLPFARDVAARFGCDHHELMVEADECRDYLPELVHQQDEPIGDPACLPMHFLSRAVRKDGVIVVLVGEGSDEVFGGYPDMAHILLRAGRSWDLLRRLPWALRVAAVELAKRMNAAPGRIDILRRARDEDPLYWGLDVVFWESEKPDLLTDDARSSWVSQARPFVRGVYEELLAVQPRADRVQQMSYMELANRLCELLLMRVDKISMAHSIEARAPFLDPDLVSYGLSLPANLKIRRDPQGQPVGKYVLKKALESVLPESVLYRPKQGFRVPLPEWLRGPLAPWAKRQMLEGTLARRNLFSRPFIEGMWERHLSGTFDHSFDLWNLINLGAWYEHWIDPPGVS